MEWVFERERIYAIDEKGELIAEATFIFKANEVVDINHTYVKPSLRGQGIAGKMMQAVAEYLRENGLKATATCAYANMWLRKHKEIYSDIISENIDSEEVACKIDGQH